MSENSCCSSFGNIASGDQPAQACQPQQPLPAKCVCLKRRDRLCQFSLVIHIGRVQLALTIVTSPLHSLIRAFLATFFLSMPHCGRGVLRSGIPAAEKFPEPAGPRAPASGFMACKGNGPPSVPRRNQDVRRKADSRCAVRPRVDYNAFQLDPHPAKGPHAALGPTGSAFGIT